MISSKFVYELIKCSDSLHRLRSMPISHEMQKEENLRQSLFEK